MAQDERKGIEIIDDFPFMLGHSKHSESFSTVIRYSAILDIFHVFGYSSCERAVAIST